MNILKSIVGGIVLTVILTTSSFAQTPPAEESTTQPGTVISTLNIQNTTIDDQVENIFHISFSISNREILQTGVKYGVRLVAETKTTRTTVDEKFYDEVLTIAPNSITKKDIIYTAPTNLSGDYTLSAPRISCLTNLLRMDKSSIQVYRTSEILLSFSQKKRRTEQVRNHV